MSVIKITGLEVYACHGVLEEEKSNPQPFIFDIAIDCNTAAAAASDDVNDTVNYAEVCALVNDFCKANSFNLIERLAYGAAYKIVEKFPSVCAAEVTVHKPKAPIGLPFADVSVTAKAERNAVALSLGSSIGDRRAMLDGAIKALKDSEGVKVLKVSDYIETTPYGGVAENTFLNCVALIECLLPPRALLELIHNIESQFGRVRDRRWADRTLDIDIVFFGNKIIEEEGLCVPHPDYFNRAFVLEPLKKIIPDYVCPLKHKRIADL